MPEVKKVEISRRTVIFGIFFILFLYFLWVIQDLLFSLIIAFIVMSALNPAVSFLERFKIPRSISSVLIFILLITGFGYLISVLIPPVIEETSALFKNLPGYINTIDARWGLKGSVDTQQLTRSIPTYTTSALDIVRGLFSNLFFLFTTIFFSLYFLIEEKLMHKLFLRFYEKKDAHAIAAIFDKAEVRMRDWMWGELTLMFTIGVMTYIGLTVIGVNYALPLALLAGLLEIVPIIGPTISAIPAIIISLPVSGVLPIFVAILYLLIQQLENQIIVPMVMKRAIGLNPIVTLAVLIVGGKLAGTLGTILALPITLCAETIVFEVIQLRKQSG